MFKYTLAATLDEMDREGITVAECPLRSMRCLSLQNGRIVGINTARFDSSAEVRTALIHEDGHFASGAFYLPYSPYQLKAQAEYRADKAAVLKHIPYPELAAELHAVLDLLPPGQPPSVECAKRKALHAERKAKRVKRGGDLREG